MSDDSEYLIQIFKDHKNPEPYSFGPLSFYYHKGMGWMRFFGKGFKWKDTSIHRLIFSERCGHKRGVQIGKWRFGLLKSITINK